MILGIDIGGTNIKFGVADENYRLLKGYSIPTGADRTDKEIVADIITTIKEIQTRYTLESIGIGSPGDLDCKNGICVTAANLPYHNTPIAAMITEATGLPVYLANDATAAVYGELYAGVGKDYENMVMITLGTGVGGGIAINGRPYLGQRGGAGEIGHMIIKYDGLPCPCGQTGCYEQYASVTSLIRLTKEAMEANPDSLLARLAEEEVTGRTAFDAKAQGCDVAAAVVDQYIQYIAMGVTGLERIFQPDAIVIGGAISNQEEALLAPLREKVKLPINVFTSQLKNDAGVIGAAVVADKKGS